jgi:hypothetical protein
MKHIFTLSLCCLALSLSAQETITYPYNPDGNADGTITVPDLQDFLGNYGSLFSPAEIMVGDTALGEWIQILYQALEDQQAVIEAMQVGAGSGLDSTAVANMIATSGGNMAFGDRMPVTLEWNSRTSNYYYSIGQATKDYVAPSDGFICGTANLTVFTGAVPGSFIKFHRDTIANPLIVAGEMAAYSYQQKSTFTFDIKEGETYRFSRQEENLSYPGLFAGDIENCFFLPISYGVDASSSASGLDSTAVANMIAEALPTPAAQIGEFRDGGVVFWVDASGQHGLVCDIQDLGVAGWGCNGTSISGADGTAIGSGQQNTIDILVGCSTVGIAAYLCDNSTAQGYSDWFLPGKDALYELYDKQNDINFSLLINGGNEFNYGFYWSSSENDIGTAWEQQFQNGTQWSFNKTYLWNVRAVRAF